MWPNFSQNDKMEDFAKLIEAVAAIAWPAIVVFVVVIFRPAVAGIIESAKSRRFTLKWGGQELTMEEVNEQQSNLISDLQTQLLDIRRRLNVAAPAATDSEVTTAISTPNVTAVLWVDDNPKNNSYFIEQLMKAGIKVDIAETTAQGILLSTKQKYDYIISDMGRYEDGTENPDAGIELLKTVRARDQKIPFIIYSSSHGIRQHGPEARELGVTALTTSPTELSGLLKLDQLKASA